MLQIRVQVLELAICGGQASRGQVEVRRERPELVSVPDDDPDREIAPCDPSERVVNLADRSDQRPRQDRPERERRQQTESRDDGDYTRQQAAVPRERRRLRGELCL